MALDTPKTGGGGPKVLPPAGVHLAVCYSIIDLGTQPNMWQGQPKPTPQIQISWELPNVLHVFDENKGPQPLSVHNIYTLSSADKAKLPAVLKTWGSLKEKPHITAELLKKYLGAPCMVTIEHKPSTKDPNTVYANIAMAGGAVSPRMQGLNVPQYPANPRLMLDLGNFNWETFDKIPKFMQEKLALSQEWSGIVAKHPRTVSQANPQVNNALNDAGSIAQGPAGDDVVF